MAASDKASDEFKAAVDAFLATKDSSKANADKKAAAAGKKADAADYALRMVPQATQADQQAAFDYAVANVSEKPEIINNTVKGSQFKQPQLEFSGSCAGCA